MKTILKAIIIILFLVLTMNAATAARIPLNIELGNITINNTGINATKLINISIKDSCTLGAGAILYNEQQTTQFINGFGVYFMGKDNENAINASLFNTSNCIELNISGETPNERMRIDYIPRSMFSEAVNLSSPYHAGRLIDRWLNISDLGIGTDAPTARLFLNSTTPKLINISNSSNTHLFFNATHLLFNETVRVCIGCNDPTHALVVNGVINATGGFITDSNLTLTTIKSCSGDLETDSNGRVICGIDVDTNATNTVVNITDDWLNLNLLNFNGLLGYGNLTNTPTQTQDTNATNTIVNITDDWLNLNLLNFNGLLGYGNLTNTPPTDTNATNTIVNISDDFIHLSTSKFNGELGFANLTNYPSACSAGQFVTQIGDTLTCATPSTSSNAGGWTIGANTIYNATSAMRLGVGVSAPLGTASINTTGNVTMQQLIFSDATVQKSAGGVLWFGNTSESVATFTQTGGYGIIYNISRLNIPSNSAAELRFSVAHSHDSATTGGIALGVILDGTQVIRDTKIDAASGSGGSGFGNIYIQPRTTNACQGGIMNTRIIATGSAVPLSNSNNTVGFDTCRPTGNLNEIIIRGGYDDGGAGNNHKTYISQVSLIVFPPNSP